MKVEVEHDSMVSHFFFFFSFFFPFSFQYLRKLPPLKQILESHSSVDIEHYCNMKRNHGYT